MSIESVKQRVASSMLAQPLTDLEEEEMHFRHLWMSASRSDDLGSCLEPFVDQFKYGMRVDFNHRMAINL